MNGPELDQQEHISGQRGDHETLQTGSSNTLRKREAIQQVLRKALVTIMNAAVTIFSMGVGVGIILGDSFNTIRTTVNESSSESASTVTGNHFGERLDDSIGNILEDSAGAGGSISHRSIVGVSQSFLPPQ